MGQQLQAPVLPSWTLGDRLRKARTHARLGTTGDMARRLGVHRNSVINYEAGRIVPPLEIVVRYSRLSHIPLEWFVGEFDDGEEAVTGQYRPMAPVRRLAIPAEGRAHVLDMPAATAAAELIDGPLTVATCHHPQLDRTHVLFLGDFSAVDGSPLNRRAWALYGGSPLHGMVVLGADDREPLDPDVIAMVTDDGFPGPEMVETMDRWLAANRPWSDES